MPGPHANNDAHAHDGPDFQLYIYVFLALAICTILSFFVYGAIGGATAAVIIMLVAVIKAALVIWIFMHVKFDWPRIYFLIVPVIILGVMMMFVLLPDIVLAWH